MDYVRKSTSLKSLVVWPDYCPAVGQQLVLDDLEANTSLRQIGFGTGFNNARINEMIYANKTMQSIYFYTLQRSITAPVFNALAQTSTLRSCEIL